MALLGVVSALVKVSARMRMKSSDAECCGVRECGPHPSAPNEG